MAADDADGCCFGIVPERKQQSKLNLYYILWHLVILRLGCIQLYIITVTSNNVVCMYIKHIKQRNKNVSAHLFIF